MQSNEIRLRFLKFFEKRGHKIIPSASLVPENDSSVLFNTAGMQPLMPYLLGEKHPEGERLVDVQKCLRTVDLDEVGDNTHSTFFEMMGNWSLGDYFKEDAIKWSYEFLTSKEEGLGMNPARLYVTVFGGSEEVPRDLESVEIWKSLGVPEDRVYFKSSKSNWWSAGPNSPAGPSTEMFYDLTGKLGNMTQEEFEKAEDEQKIVEIWNDVFMIYKQEEGKVMGELPKRNVDTGAGLERITMVCQGKNNIYDTDLFAHLLALLPTKLSDRVKRIIVDHTKAITFLLAEGVRPSNKDQGYVLRKLIRRILVHEHLGTFGSFSGNDILGIGKGLDIKVIIEKIIEQFKEFYPEIESNKDSIFKEFNKEEKKFRETLRDGLRELKKLDKIDSTSAFKLYETFGLPFEIIKDKEISGERAKSLTQEDFNKKMKEHQELSRTASTGMFKGGLADHKEGTIKLHTAHHLLLAALKEVVGSDVKQRGSNITEKRLRIDFLCDHKLTDEEKKKVEDWVNEKIEEGLNVIKRGMSLEEAKKVGAEMEFGTKYPDMVSVYFIGPGDTPYSGVSIECCGGPHVSNTLELAANPDGAPKHFKILKEEAVAKGMRRIKAVLE